jgi:hypothetical protein
MLDCLPGKACTIIWRYMEQVRNTILTWGRAGELFEYEGSVVSGTAIHYGEGYQRSAIISAADYAGY